MRVLHVIESFGAGSMQIAVTISERLAAAGHQVAIAHGNVSESPTDARAAAAPAVELFAVPWGRRPLMQLTAGRELRAIARRWRPDVIHLHSSFAGAVGAAALGGTAPLIYTPHAYSFASGRVRPLAAPVFRGVERLVAHRVALVGAVSAAEGELAHQIGAPRVTVIPNGIPELDDPPSGPKLVDGARPRVVAVGRIAPQRRPQEVARILASVADIADVEWVGGGTDGSVAELRAAGVPVSGWLSRAEVLDRLAAASACLHWSAWDGSPLAILEALSRDTVVVASDIPANREIIGARQVRSDVGDAAALLRAVLTDAALRELLLAHQREIRSRYSAARMVADWLAAYELVATQSR